MDSAALLERAQYRAAQLDAALSGFPSAERLLDWLTARCQILASSRAEQRLSFNRVDLQRALQGSDSGIGLGLGGVFGGLGGAAATASLGALSALDYQNASQNQMRDLQLAALFGESQSRRYY